MALYKRNQVWWVSFSHNGQRVQRSTGTTNKVAAQEYYDKYKAELWSVTKLDNKLIYSWRDAVIRWLNESEHKRSIETDKMHLRWLDPYLRDFQLHEITRDVAEDVANKKEAEGVSPTTVNRMRHVEKQRIRWLTLEEANLLLNELPSHLKDMAAFTLATGLRASNVTELQWLDVDMKKRHAWIHPDQAKTKKAIPVPLNENAMAVLKARHRMHARFVFTYKNNSIEQCNTKAWRKALERAAKGIRKSGYC